MAVGGRNQPVRQQPSQNVDMFDKLVNALSKTAVPGTSPVIDESSRHSNIASAQLMQDQLLKLFETLETCAEGGAKHTFVTKQIDITSSQLDKIHNEINASYLINIKRPRI